MILHINKYILEQILNDYDIIFTISLNEYELKLNDKRNEINDLNNEIKSIQNECQKNINKYKR